MWLYSLPCFGDTKKQDKDKAERNNASNSNDMKAQKTSHKSRNRAGKKHQNASSGRVCQMRPCTHVGAMDGEWRCHSLHK